MGKHEKFSPKAVANKIKSKGLQKLRWYCQMCQKQCRDQNGFKCHTTSEAHQRQLLLFGENPNQFLGSFSGEFETGFMDILRRQYGTRRVAANQVYQEYIKHKDHIHMNSTKWMTLTGFCMHLGKAGKAVVDETEKGWFIKYIERDPEEIRRQETLRKREKVELDDEERIQKYVTDQVDRALDETTPVAPEFSELQRNEDEKVAFTFAPAIKREEVDPADPSIPSTSGQLPSSSQEFKVPLKFNALQIAAAQSRASSTSRAHSVAKSTTSSVSVGKRKSALEEIKEEEERRKRQKELQVERKDYWLCKNIIVKVITDRLGPDFHKRKGVVKDVLDRHTALVQILDSDRVVKLDDVHVQTVLPAIGRAVMVVNGAYRGEEATLESIDEARGSTIIRLTTGSSKGQTVKGVKYEDISKLVA
ncbi:DNA/RNA-binding protein KIN17 [Hypsibius exemplaris]|uniref:DNA/RNA-binding protein KIN17 n=1 Tax=Hypsibius exemplaris TaxID=2072580 RepID=A0A1W0XDC1_HYPEX|nr:DNA/RNA-binding protein KIN17 [Hypsibius exemplaris]